LIRRSSSFFDNIPVPRKSECTNNKSLMSKPNIEITRKYKNTSTEQLLVSNKLMSTGEKQIEQEQLV